MARYLILFFAFYNIQAFAEEWTFSEKLVIEKGVCPFECCTYRKWYAEKDLALYESPDKESPVVAKLVEGEEVKAITGEMHIIPSKFIFNKPHWQGYKPMDVIWILHNEGEGEYRAWNGKKKVGIIFDDPNDNDHFAADACEREWSQINCAGTLMKPLQSVWWVKAQTKHKITGWTYQPDDFRNLDACGG